MWGKRKPSDFQAEIEAHVQLEADQLRAEGLTPAEAQMGARRAFGNRTRAVEQFYESGRWMFWDHLMRDLRFAVRMLAKDPRFSTLAVLGLALGIAVSTAVFTLINAFLQLNEVRPDAKSYVGITRVVNGRTQGDFSYSDYCYYRDRATTLRAVTAQSGRERFLMGQTSGGEPEEVQGRFDSANFLSAFGLRPVLGRSFSPAEEQAGGEPVALLAFRFWKLRFGSDPGVLGKTVTINAHPLTIVGVADARYGAGDTSDFYLPLGLQPVLLGRGDWLHDAAKHWLMLEGALRLGISSQQAQGEVNVLARAQQQSVPAIPGDGGIVVTPGGFNPDKRREMIAMVVAVTIAVSMILLIACSNLANLLLARAVVRRREIGVRLSLGAGRMRVVAQLLTESMLLALAGGMLGLVFSHWLAKGLLIMMNAPPGMAFDLQIEPLIVFYALVLSIATGLSFGLAPALTATRMNLSQALHAEWSSGTAGGQSRRIWTGRNALVIVPLAVSLMLLLGAGVALRQVQRRAFNGPTFDTSHLIGTSFRLNMQGYSQARTLQFQENLRQRIASMPGVTSVALATTMPLSNGLAWFPLAVEGRQTSSGSPPRADYNVISPEFFQTVGAPVVRGRGFSADDRAGAPPVAIVNQDFARRYWTEEEPIGKRIRLSGGVGPYFEVVGVAPDMQGANSPYNSVRPTVYVPYAQGMLFLKGIDTDPPPYQMQFVARTRGETAALKAAIREEVRATDSALRVNIQTVEESLEARFGPVKRISMLLSALSGLALLMASVGIYAILAYAVSQRRREIGIRTALGAQPREILALVMQRTVVLIA